MGEVGDLLLDPLYHPECRVAHRGHGDARAKVDQAVVVNVRQNSSASTRDIDARPFAVPGDLDPGRLSRLGDVGSGRGGDLSRPTVNSSSTASAVIVEVGQLDVDLRS